MATRSYEGKKFNTDSSQKTWDALTVEEALQININETAFTVSMRTPGDDAALVRGLLHAEGVINDLEFTPDIVLKKENEQGIVTVVNVSIPKEKLGEGYTNSRSLLSVSSCGICGKTQLEDLAFVGKVMDQQKQLELNSLQDMFARMRTKQFDFNQSGGTHAAAAFTLDGTMLSCLEDIGRHNAVDKVVGQLIQQQQIKEAKVLTVSGRISYEIVIKCFKAQIPFLAAVSAPSSLAVDYAKELGITLLGFCRDGRATAYSHANKTIIKTRDSQGQSPLAG